MVGLLRLGISCNQCCVFCTATDEKEETLSTKNSKEKIDLLVQWGEEELVFTGGEPTLREDLTELISYAKKRGAKKVELQTNGVLLSDIEKVNTLSDSGLDRALVSVHSHKKEVSDRLTQKEGTHAKTLEGIQNLLETGIEVTLSHVINTLNYKHMVEYVTFFSERFGINNFYFAMVRPNGRAHENKWVVPKLTEIELCLYEAMDFCRARKIGFSVEGVPLCYMCGYAEKCSETTRMFKKKSPYIGNDSAILENIHQVLLQKHKTKDEKCYFCEKSKICAGVWKEYAEIHGTGDLVPIFQ